MFDVEAGIGNCIILFRVPIAGPDTLQEGRSASYSEELIRWEISLTKSESTSLVINRRLNVAETHYPGMVPDMRVKMNSLKEPQLGFVKSDKIHSV